MTVVRCQDCHAVLEFPAGMVERPPCPHCGSTRRLFEKPLVEQARSIESFAKQPHGLLVKFMDVPRKK
jgi:hypothetical protein